MGSQGPGYLKLCQYLKLYILSQYLIVQSQWYAKQVLQIDFTEVLTPVFNTLLY